MARPASTPDWSAAGVEPSGPEKAAGWSFRMKPPASYFNWFWTLLSDWTTYLDAKVNGSSTFYSSPRIPLAGFIMAVGEWLGDHWRVAGANPVQSPAGTNTYIETTAAGALHTIALDLNYTHLFDRIIGPGDVIQIDTITVSERRLGANDTLDIVLIGSAVGIVDTISFGPGPFVGSSVGVFGDKLDSAQIWTVELQMRPTNNNDCRIISVLIDYTITTA